MADDEDLAATTCDCGPDRLGSRPGCEALVWLRRPAEGAAQLGCGLAGAEQGAGQHRDRMSPLGGEPNAEGARGLAAGGCQPAKVVGLAARGLRVADEVEAHSRRIGQRRWGGVSV